MKQGIGMKQGLGSGVHVAVTGEFLWAPYKHWAQYSW